MRDIIKTETKYAVSCGRFRGKQTGGCIVMLTFEKVQTSADITECAALAAEIWNQHFSAILSQEQIDYMVSKFQSERALRQQIDMKGYSYYFFTVDGCRVGYFGICPQKDKTMFLSKIYMKKAYRGNGYATKGFAFIQELARELGCSKIWLTVNRYNEDSIAVYEHWGMKQSGVHTKEIGQGFIMDDYVYSYPLT